MTMTRVKHGRSPEAVGVRASGFKALAGMTQDLDSELGAQNTDSEPRPRNSGLDPSLCKRQG